MFFPEKRLFFQERSSLFDFAFDANEQSRLFYSRRIGLQDGRAVRIYGGARLVGRIGDWDLGFLDMQTGPLGAIPSANFGVLRVRRRIFNAYSTIGAIVTSKIGADGSYNEAYGLDLTVRPFGDDFIYAKWAQTFKNGARNDPLSLDPSRIFVSWQRLVTKGLGYAFTYSRAGADYDPEMGFEMRQNFSKYLVYLTYGWMPGERSAFFNHYASVCAYAFRRNVDGSMESAFVFPAWNVFMKSGLWFYAGPTASYENVTEAFSLAEGVTVPRGVYRFLGLSGVLQLPPGRPFGAKIETEAGRFYDGRRISLSVAPSWHVSAGLELGGFLQVNRVDFPSRGRRFDGQVASLRLLSMLDTKFSASAFIQFNSAAHGVMSNFRLRYNPREGVDLYLVYNEGLNTDREREIPELPRSGGRTVMLKCAYTFNI